MKKTEKMMKTKRQKGMTTMTTKITRISKAEVDVGCVIFGLSGWDSIRTFPLVSISVGYWPSSVVL